MHSDFLTLQKRCRRYRIKKVVKFLIPIFLLLFVVVGYYFLTPIVPKSEVISPTNSMKEKKITVPKKVVVKAVIEKKEVLQKRVVSPKKEIVKQEKVVVPQKFKDVAYVMQINENRVLEIKQKTKVKKKEKVIHKERVIHKIIKPVKAEFVSKHKKSTDFEVSVKKYDNLKQMEEMYKKEKKYSLALKIGEQYFKKKKYSKSLMWSKEANILDHKAEGAWLLYAKSEYAKGNKKRAIKLLSLYLGNTQSLEVESLLSLWMREKR
jgi:hypothetical protein